MKVSLEKIPSRKENEDAARKTGFPLFKKISKKSKVSVPQRRRKRSPRPTTQTIFSLFRGYRANRSVVISGREVLFECSFRKAKRKIKENRKMSRLVNRRVTLWIPQSLFSRRKENVSKGR